MLDSIGTSCTLGVLAAVSTVIGILISLLAQPPRKFERRSTEVAGWGTFKEAIFTLLFIANFIHPLTVANPATFGPVFSETVGINGRDGAMLLAIVSLVGIPSRLSIGWAADVIGHTNIVIIVTGIYCIGVWCLWLPAATNNSRVLWTVFNVMYGVVNGTFNIVVNSLQKKLFGDELYYSYNGAITSIRGVGYVIGVPIAGALVKQGRDDDLSGTDFTMPIIYNGALLTIALVCLLGIRIVDARKIEWAWAR
jgi:MFS family permease